MITEHDLQEAIAECQGERNPNAQTCIKLAAFYTIRDHLYPEPQQDQIEPRTYSYTAAPDSTGDTIFYSSGTELGKAVEGRSEREIWPLIEELVEAVRILNPRLYNGFMEKLHQ